MHVWQMRCTTYGHTVARVQRERHIEKIKSTLTAVKAIADVPQATTMVPAFRTFLETKVLLNNDMAAVYNKLSA